MMMIGMAVVWVVLLALLVAGLTWLFPSAMSSRGPSGPAQDPMTIASARYAQGEITREQFQLMCRDLGAVEHMDDTPTSEPSGETQELPRTGEPFGKVLDS